MITEFCYNTNQVLGLILGYFICFILGILFEHVRNKFVLQKDGE